MGFHQQRTMWLWRNQDNVTHRQLLSIDQVWWRSTALTWSRWGCRRLADNIWLLAHDNNNNSSSYQKVFVHDFTYEVRRYQTTKVSLPGQELSHNLTQQQLKHQPNSCHCLSANKNLQELGLFYMPDCPSCHPTNSVKALKEKYTLWCAQQLTDTARLVYHIKPKQKNYEERYKSRTYTF